MTGECRGRARDRVTGSCRPKDRKHFRGCGNATSQQGPSPPFPLAAAAPSLYYYDSAITNNSYVLDTQSKTFNQAEGYCASTFGGHLLAFNSLEEQLEVGGCSLPCTRCVSMFRGRNSSKPQG